MVNKFLVIFICFAIAIQFVECKCEPRFMNLSKFKFKHRNGMAARNLYDCRLMDGESAIVCGVKVPFYPCDDMVTFKVSRGVSGKCESSVCKNEKQSHDTLLWRNHNGKYSTEREIDVSIRSIDSYHFCYRQTANGKTCDINYAITDYEYTDNGICLFKNVAEFVASAVVCKTKIGKKTCKWLKNKIVQKILN